MNLTLNAVVRWLIYSKSFSLHTCITVILFSSILINLTMKYDIKINPDVVFTKLVKLNSGNLLVLMAGLDDVGSSAHLYLN